MSAVLRIVPHVSYADHGDTGQALLAIALIARLVDRGEAVCEADDLALDFAAELFDVIGCWSQASDAAMVRALQRAVESGRRLHPLDRGRLREIVSRAHGALEDLDRRVAE